jgi:hypothetical protein
MPLTERSAGPRPHPAAPARGHLAAAGITVAVLAVLVLATTLLPRQQHGEPPPEPPAGQVDLPPPGRPLYVTPAGNDANPGTSARPLRTLQRAADLATPGTVVRVAPGLYAPVVTHRSGRAGAPIVFHADKRWAARIVSTGTVVPWWNHASHVDIVGFDVTAPAARLGLVSEGSYVRFASNRVHTVAKTAPCSSAGGAAIDHADYGGTGNQVIGNDIADIGPDAGCNLIHGIYVAQAKAVVQGNSVREVSGWCIHTWHAATAVTIVDNVVVHCGVAAARSGGGILVGAGDDPPGAYARDFLVARNTVLDSYRGILQSGRIGPGNIIRDNTVDRIGAVGDRRCRLCLYP